MEIEVKGERKTNEIRGVLRAQLNPVWKVKKKGRARAQSERTRWIVSPRRTIGLNKRSAGQRPERYIYAERERDT
jgi:hypothetical protein